MKKASIGLLILALVGLAGATTFVRNSTTTHVEGWITVPIACLDTFPSAGPLKPDSIQVFVWRDSMGYNTCTWDTSITDTSSAFLDFKKRGNTAGNTPFWYFRAQISDVDGDGSVGPYHGMIQAFAQAHPTPNRFSFQIIDDDTTVSTLVHRMTNLLADGSLDSSAFTWGFYRAMKRYVWLDTLMNYMGIDAEPTSGGYLYRIHNFTDGDGFGGIDADIGNPSDDLTPTRVAWATDDSLGTGGDSCDLSAVKALLDSILASVGYDTAAPTEMKSLQQKLGREWLLSEPTVRQQFEDLAVMLDSLDRRLGWPGVSRIGDPLATLFHILGAYSGGPGDNNNIKEDVGALSLTGSGSEACTLIARQNGLNPIQGARIVIRTVDQSATRVPGLCTDSNGKGITELDYGDYFVSITANNYVSLSDTLFVNSDSTWDFSMTLFDPGKPPSPSLCRVYGWVYDITGDSLANAVVTAEIPSGYQPVKFGDVIVTPFSKSTTTDSTGYWQLDLFPNSVLSEPLSKYLFTIEYPSGVVYKSRVTVPESASWQLK